VELHLVSQGAAVVGAYSDSHHAALIAQLFGGNAKVKAVSANAIPEAVKTVQINAIPDEVRGAAEKRGMALPANF
jgi:hypothetical protein